MYLFIDTTQKITLGLLDKNLAWKDFYFDPKVVISTKLHLLVQQMLAKHSLELSEVVSLIYIAGPGSYTGMRVAEGIAQIMEWQKFNCYSFYHFDIPQLIGEESGVWYDDAYKGESFVYEWQNDQSRTYLVKNEQLTKYLDGKKVFTQYSEDSTRIGTAQLIEQMPQTIFNKVINQQMKKNLYYYRSLENEFQKC